MSSEQPNSSLKAVFANNRGLAIVAGLMVIGFVAMVVLVLWLLLNDEMTVDANPTPFSDTTESVVSNTSLITGVSDTDTISVTLDVPATLQIGSRSFVIKSQVVSADRVWSPRFDGADTAVWVYGTIINYIVGLADTEENQALLEQLAPGDQMALVTRNGVNYAFSLSSRAKVLVGNPDIYAQQTPGLTLILVGSEGEERLVVNGRYVVDETGGGSQGQINVVELGEKAQLDDVQITVTGTTYVLDRSEAQPGFAFYLVDYRIQNIGLSALDTSRLRLTLLDDLGNQYAVSPVAGQLGNYPALGGFLNTSQTTMATAGYQIPLGLNSTNVNWTVTCEDTGGQLKVTIPLSGGPQTTGNTQVTLTEVTVSPDLARLVLSGQVANLDEQPAIVSETEFSLRTEDSAFYLMLATNPAFPWTVAPGQSIQYSVTYQRPIAADIAIFTVLNQPFQLSHLR